VSKAVLCQLPASNALAWDDNLGLIQPLFFLFSRTKIPKETPSVQSRYYRETEPVLFPQVPDVFDSCCHSCLQDDSLDLRTASSQYYLLQNSFAWLTCNPISIIFFLNSSSNLSNLTPGSQWPRLLIPPCPPHPPHTHCTSQSSVSANPKKEKNQKKNPYQTFLISKNGVVLLHRTEAVHGWSITVLST
jgi:hypothetical protein